MSWEAWGTPDDPEPNPCEMCENEIGSSSDCKLCLEHSRAEKAGSALNNLVISLRHRVRILRSRSVYEQGKKDNGVSVELLQAITLLAATPGLEMEGLDPRFVVEAQKALLTLENAQYLYAARPIQCDGRDGVTGSGASSEAREATPASNGSDGHGKDCA
jgi:hypothetical protein